MKNVLQMRKDNIMKQYIKYICLFLILGMSTEMWGAKTGTIEFGNSGTKINAASVSGSDSQGNTWKIVTEGTSSYTQNAGYSQVGKSTEPATSITFGVKLPRTVKITSFSAKFGGFNSTAGSVTLKVTNISTSTTTSVGTGSLSGTSDVTVSSSSEATGDSLTVTVTSIDKGVKCYYVSYTYTNAKAYYIVYDPKGGTCATEDDEEASANAGVELPDVTPSSGAASMGWGFYGWAEDAEDDPTTTPPTIVGKAGDTYYPDADITLHAVFAKGEYTKITDNDDIESGGKYLIVGDDYTNSKVYAMTHETYTDEYDNEVFYGVILGSSPAATYSAADVNASWRYSITGSKNAWYIQNITTSKYVDTDNNPATEIYINSKTSGHNYTFNETSHGFSIQNNSNNKGYPYLVVYADDYGFANEDDPWDGMLLYKETKTPTYCSNPSTVRLVSSPAAGGSVVFDDNSSAEMDFATDDGYIGDITAIPNSGYDFLNWVSSDESAAVVGTNDDPTTGVIAEGSATITANFYQIRSISYILTEGGVAGEVGNPTTVTKDEKDGFVVGFNLQAHYKDMTLVSVTMGGSPMTEGSGADYEWEVDGSTAMLTIHHDNIDGDIVITVSATLMEYTKYAFSCSELTLTPHLATTGTPIFITSTASKTVRSQDYIEITGNGLTPSTALTFPGLPSKFAIKNADGTAVTTDGNGEISANAYIFYTPDAGDTSDGLDELTGITVSVGGAKPKTVVLEQDIIGRHLPADFVIAVKYTDNQWYALPADLGSASNPSPVAIRVNNESNPTIAYCANTNSYTLYQDNVSNSQKVILGTTNNKNGSGVSYALWGSPSGNTLGINTGVVVTGNPGDQYKWTLTQTATSISTIADAKYNIRVSGNSNDLKLWTNAGLTKWGSYASGVKELRLLTLSEVAPMTMSVMEWGTDAIVVSYPNGGSATSPQARIGDGDAANVTLTSLGGDIYKIATISGLQDNPAKTLIITATESGTGKQALFPIPLIVTTAKTEAELRTAAGSNDVAKLTDVVIRNGGRVTTGTNSGNFNDIYIYPGGKAKITNNFAANNIYMRGGYSFLDEKESFRYPDLCVEGAVTINLPDANKLYYDFYIDNRKYYMFSMPYDVTLSTVTDETGSEDFPVWVKHYDGNLRASGHGVSGWTWYGDEVGQESFFAGIGYEITAQPNIIGRPIAIIRFPVITGDITTDAGNSPGVTVTYYGKSAYEAGTQTANNVGWNFIGNPYLTEYKAVTDTDMIVQSSFVEQMENDQWTGSYEWKVTTARFITVPYDTYNDYHHELVKNYTIPAFSTFFFQFADDAYGTFHMGGTRPQAALAPARFGATPKATPEISLDIMLSGTGEAEEGKAGLIIHESYDGGLKDFEDVEQWFVGNNVQKTYTFASGTALAYNLLNEEAINELIPMGYIATVGGEHVYALNEENDVSALEHLWLIDYTTGVTTDLLVRNYSFVTAAGRFDSRFAINAVLKQEEVPTDISNTPGGDWTTTIGVYSDENMLTLRGLPDNSAVYIYDMNGRLLQSSENLSNIASFSIATQGVYNIRVIAEGKAITLRTVLR